jgi:hypothetical protein
MIPRLTPLEYLRRRPWLAATILGVVILGLASREYAWLFPAALGKYPGDALWALMVYLGVAFLWPRIAIVQLAGISLSISFLDEFSQLYHAPWIDAIRAIPLGHIILGSSFCAMDLVAYSVGIAIGVAGDVAVARINAPPRV